MPCISCFAAIADCQAGGSKNENLPSGSKASEKYYWIHTSQMFFFICTKRVLRQSDVWLVMTSCIRPVYCAVTVQGADPAAIKSYNGSRWDFSRSVLPQLISSSHVWFYDWSGAETLMLQLVKNAHFQKQNRSCFVMTAQWGLSSSI